MCDTPNFYNLLKYLNLYNKKYRYCGTTPEKSLMADCEDGCEKCIEYKAQYEFCTPNQALHLITLILDKLTNNEYCFTQQHKNNLYQMFIYSPKNARLLAYASNKFYSEALSELILKLAEVDILKKKEILKVFKRC